MKTVFVSQNGSTSSGNKRIYQKPNILRRKTKSSLKVTTPRTFETTLVTLNIGLDQQLLPATDLEGHEISINMTNDKGQPNLVQGVVVLDSYSKGLNSENFTVVEPNIYSYDTGKNVSQNTIINVDNVSHTTPKNAEVVDVQNVMSNKNNGAETPIINVESFLNNSTQITQYQDGNTVINSEKNNWCIDFSAAQQIIIEDYDGSELASLHSMVEPIVSVPSPCAVQQQTTGSSSIVPVDTEQQICTFYVLPSFQCDKEGCNKSFKSKKRLTCHKRTHIPSSGVKEPRLYTVECPAHKPGSNESCGMLFLNRDALTRHIKEVHTLDDAMFLCVECGRRFYYRLGLQAHSRAHMPPAVKPSLLCGWPGCGRVFQQPCRLREHQRAHTGDKPYPCNYPNCNWSFRNASKLMRHARRHTGERRHACAECGHAFLRREHLRDHATRHHVRATCRHASCQKDTKSSICKHKGSVQKADEAKRNASLQQHQSMEDLIPPANPDTPLEEFKYMCFIPKQTTKKKANKSKSKTNLKTVTKTKARSKNTTKYKETRVVGTEVRSTTISEIDEDTPWRVFSTTDNETDEHTEWQCADANEDEWYNKAQVVSQGNVDLQADADLQAEDLQTDADLQAEDLQVGADSQAETDSQDDTDTQEEAEGGEWHAARTHCTWPLQPRPADVLDSLQGPQYSLEDDVQVELSEEGSESNTYTIRSDLFLHGNMLINEDSEHIPSVSVSLPGAAPDTGLSLLDAHPTIDLMQEDLMYTDAAVDESSFRVLLLNGDELV